MILIRRSLERSAMCRRFMLALTVTICACAVGCSDPERNLVDKIIDRPTALRHICESDPIGRAFVKQELWTQKRESLYVRSIIKIAHRTDRSYFSEEFDGVNKGRSIRVVSHNPDLRIYEFQFRRDSFGSRLSSIVEFGGDLLEQ